MSLMVASSIAQASQLGGRLLDPLAEVIPSPGPGVLYLAQSYSSDSWERLAEEEKSRLLRIAIASVMTSRGNIYLPCFSQGQVTLQPCVGGHPWDLDRDGPIPIMVIGKMLGTEELRRGYLFQGVSGEYLQEGMSRAGLDMSACYVTNLLKTAIPDPQRTALLAEWIADGVCILYQELALVQPDFVLCVGLDAARALLRTRASLRRLDGDVFSIRYPVRVWRGKEGWEAQYRSARLMVSLHPAAVSRDEKLVGRFHAQLGRFASLVRGESFAEDGLDHQEIRDESSLKEAMERMEREVEDRVVAVDAEWHGEHPQNEGSYLLSIQLSWRPKQAICVSLRGAGGKVLFQPNPDRAIEILHSALRDKRIVGHYFTADLEWLVNAGLDCEPQYRAARTCHQQRRGEGGFDTALMAHAIDETGPFELDQMVLRYLPGVPCYWKRLEEAYAAARRSQSGVSGYGMVPDEIRVPYAMYDADVTLRLFRQLLPMLSSDAHGNDCWYPFWLAQRAVSAAAEMQQVGIAFDWQRWRSLSDLFASARDRCLALLRQWSAWPTFNAQSVPQTQCLLFGRRYAPVAPAGARLLALRPVLSTGKPPMPWEEVIARGVRASPSTSQRVLTVLLAQCRRAGDKEAAQVVEWLLQVRLVNEMLKNVLKPVELDEHGHRREGGGLASHICDDGRVRTTFYLTKETGRWSSVRPPLQNLVGRRESDYRSLFGEAYRYPIRSMFRAERGYRLVAADFKGAELMAMAIASGDEQLLEDYRRGLLPADDPRHYDIHSAIAVEGFRLDLPPSKKALEEAGKGVLREIAKTVVFGLAYGRGASAIAEEFQQREVECSVEDAERLMEGFFRRYPAVAQFREECRRRALDPGCLSTCFRRWRRFPPATDEESAQRYIREALNFPIQGLVADIVNIGLWRLLAYRERLGWTRADYRLVLQIHDEVMLEVREDRLKQVCEEIIPVALGRIEVPARDLSGTPLARGPYHLGVDIEVYDHWGEPVGGI